MCQEMFVANAARRQLI